MKKIAITLTIMAMSIFCFGQNYYQSYHHTVYTNIGGTTYVTYINGYGSRSYVTTYEVTSRPTVNERREEKEKLNRGIDQYDNEMKMREKWEYGEITYEEYCAAVPQEFRSANKDKNGLKSGGWKLSEAMHRLNVERLAEGKNIIKSYPSTREFNAHYRAITKELKEARIAAQSRD